MWAAGRLAESCWAARLPTHTWGVSVCRLPNLPLCLCSQVCRLWSPEQMVAAQLPHEQWSEVLPPILSFYSYLEARKPGGRWVVEAVLGAGCCGEGQPCDACGQGFATAMCHSAIHPGFHHCQPDVQAWRLAWPAQPVLTSTLYSLPSLCRPERATASCCCPGVLCFRRQGSCGAVRGRRLRAGAGGQLHCCLWGRGCGRASSTLLSGLQAT
jgi:hypothetical protein